MNGRWRKLYLSVNRELIVFLLFMICSAMTLNVFMQTRSLEEGSKSFGFEKMLNGTAARPYVYRQLVPHIANYVASLIPQEEHKDFVHYHLDKFHLKQRYFYNARYKNKGVEEWTPTYSIKFHVVYLIMFFSLLATLYCLRWLLNFYYSDQYSSNSITPIIFVSLLPITFLHGNFYYDFPELFFLSALLLSALKRQYILWILLLPLAVFNKESNMLVPLLYITVLYQVRHSWSSIVYILSSGSIALLVYVFIKIQFDENVGGTVISQFESNISYWTDLKNYLLWNDFFVPLIPFPRGLNILWMLFIGSLIFIAWKNKPLQLKMLLLVAFLINIPLFILFCYQDEMRNLSFIFIPIFLIISHTFYFLFSNQKETNL